MGLRGPADRQGGPTDHTHRAPLNPRPHNLDAVAAGAVEAARIASGDKYRMSYVPAREPVLASFDPERMEQAVGILLDNTIKYTPEGGRIAVKTARDNGHARLEVSDTGIGVAREDIPRIFNRFYRTAPPPSSCNCERRHQVYFLKRDAFAHLGFSLSGKPRYRGKVLY